MRARGDEEHDIAALLAKCKPSDDEAVAGDTNVLAAQAILQNVASIQEHVARGCTNSEEIQILVRGDTGDHHRLVLEGNLECARALRRAITIDLQSHTCGKKGSSYLVHVPHFHS